MSDSKCGGCYHFTRCEWLISATVNRDYCDWTPSRFHSKAVTPCQGECGTKQKAKQAEGKS